MEKLLTQQQLADRYGGLSLITLRDWRYKKKGPRWTKRGGTVLYRESDVLAWEAEEDERARAVQESA